MLRYKQPAHFPPGYCCQPFLPSFVPTSLEPFVSYESLAHIFRYTSLVTTDFFNGRRGELKVGRKRERVSVLGAEESIRHSSTLSCSPLGVWCWDQRQLKVHVSHVAQNACELPAMLSRAMFQSAGFTSQQSLHVLPGLLSRKLVSKGWGFMAQWRRSKPWNWFVETSFNVARTL